MSQFSLEKLALQNFNPSSGETVVFLHLAFFSSCHVWRCPFQLVSSQTERPSPWFPNPIKEVVPIREQRDLGVIRNSMKTLDSPNRLTTPCRPDTVRRLCFCLFTQHVEKSKQQTRSEFHSAHMLEVLPTWHPWDTECFRVLDYIFAEVYWWIIRWVCA